MEHRAGPSNPRLDVLRREVEQEVLNPLRSHGWEVNVVHDVDRYDCIEIVAKRSAVEARIAVLYSSSGISNSSYRELSYRVDRIFYRGQPHMLDSFAKGVSVPVEPLDGFFAFLVDLNKQVEPDCSPAASRPKPRKVLRLTVNRH